MRRGPDNLTLGEVLMVAGSGVEGRCLLDPEMPQDTKSPRFIHVCVIGIQLYYVLSLLHIPLRLLSSPAARLLDVLRNNTLSYRENQMHVCLSTP